jgi:type II secretory pathway component PulM
MKNAVICSLLFTALVAQPAAAHTAIGEMLRDAAVNHDLDKIRIDRLELQRQVDGEEHPGASSARLLLDLKESRQSAFQK